VAGLLVDTGYPPTAMPLGEMRRGLPCAIHEVFRIETCAQTLLREALPFDDFVEAARAAFRAGAERSVGLKSIIAYRSGLAVRPPERGPAARAYERVVRRVHEGGSSRLEDKPLLDLLFGLALDVARETGRPLQIHSGFGDPDIDLLQANPLLLRPILEDGRGRGLRLVLLHQSYPYVREAAFMTAVWPQVHLDLSLALPFLGPGAAVPLIELLSLAPATKLLYGSDVSALPELFALCADWARAALAEALAWLIERDALTVEEGGDVARRILWENAASLYGLDPP
jgi:predicted TIM-barrel fold metal-dependent hydrolase